MNTYIVYGLLFNKATRRIVLVYLTAIKNKLNSIV
jgi:hypothetical protein